LRPKKIIEVNDTTSTNHHREVNSSEQTFSHSRIISCPPLQGALQWLSFVTIKSEIAFLSNIVFETTGSSGTVNFPGIGPSKSTWKQSRTALKSIDDGWLR
jgi:hypothetical protein